MKWDAEAKLDVKVKLDVEVKIDFCKKNPYLSNYIVKSIYYYSICILNKK